MKRLQVSVVPAEGGGWSVMVDGKLYDQAVVKSEAVSTAVAFCRRISQCTLQIQCKDGRIHTKIYGDDDRPAG